MGFAGGLFVTRICFGSHCISHFPWSSALRYEALVPIFFSRISLCIYHRNALEVCQSTCCRRTFSIHPTQHTTYIIIYSITHTPSLLFCCFFTHSPFHGHCFFIASFSVSLQLTPSRRASRSKPQIYILLPWVSYKNL